MKARCGHCGARGHVASPDYAGCSRAFQAVQAIKRRRLSMREAADLFEISVGAVMEALRRDPEAHRIALARAAEVRAERASSVPPLAALAARAVHEDDLMVQDASRSYGVTPAVIRSASRKLYPDVVVDRRRRRW